MKNSRDLILRAKLFIYLSSIISLIRDFIYRMVTIFRFDHMIGENLRGFYEDLCFAYALCPLQAGGRGYFFKWPNLTPETVEISQV